MAETTPTTRPATDVQPTRERVFPRLEAGTPSRLRQQFQLPSLGQLFTVAFFGGAAFLVALALGWAGAKDSLQMFALAGLLGLIFGLSALLKPELGLFCLIFITYTNLSHVAQVSFGLPALMKPLVALIAVSVLVSRFIMRREKVTVNRTAVMLVIYNVVIILSYFVAQDKWLAREIIIDYLKDVVIFLLIINIADNEKTWVQALWVFVLSGAFLAALSSYQALTGNFGNTFFELAIADSHEITAGIDRPRVSGPLGDPNFYAQILVMALPIAIYRVLDEKRPRVKLLFGGATAVFLIAIMFTYSRGAFLDLMILAVLIALDRKVKPYYIVAGALIFFLLILPILPAEYQDRVGTLNFLSTLTESRSSQTVRSIEEASFQGRTSELLAAIEMFKDNPILGVGIGNYSVRYLEYAPRIGIDMRGQEREAHSLFFEIAANTGVLGEITFVLLLASAFVSQAKSIETFDKIGRKDLSSWVKGTRLGVLGFLITGIFLHGAFARYMWLLIGLATAAEPVAQREYLRYREAIRRRRRDAVLRGEQGDEPAQQSLKA